MAGLDSYILPSKPTTRPLSLSRYKTHCEQQTHQSAAKTQNSAKYRKYRTIAPSHHSTVIVRQFTDLVIGLPLRSEAERRLRRVFLEECASFNLELLVNSASISTSREVQIVLLYRTYVTALQKLWLRNRALRNWELINQQLRNR